jgi:hypothetical protein
MDARTAANDEDENCYSLEVKHIEKNSAVIDTAGA